MLRPPLNIRMVLKGLDHEIDFKNSTKKDRSRPKKGTSSFLTFHIGSSNFMFKKVKFFEFHVKSTPIAYFYLPFCSHYYVWSISTVPNDNS